MQTTSANSDVLVKLFPVSSGTKHRVPIDAAKPATSTGDNEEAKPQTITTVAVRNLYTTGTNFLSLKGFKLFRYLINLKLLKFNLDFFFW